LQIRVAGFEPKSLPHNVGKVQFQVMTAELLNELDIKNELTNNTVREKYLGQIGARLIVTAVDSDAAIEIAIREVRKSLDVVNFNGFEKRLISALQWAGRASIQERSDQAFLFYAISLENLLLGTKRETELSYRLSLYGAHLFGDSRKSRMETHERLKNLYRLRSGIVHAGSALIGETELALIRHYAKRGILMLLLDEAFSKMVTEEDLDNYFKSRVLGQ
jgi:hypothetical protein